MQVHIHTNRMPREIYSQRHTYTYTEEPVLTDVVAEPRTPEHTCTYTLRCTHKDTPTGMHVCAHEQDCHFHHSQRDWRLPAAAQCTAIYLGLSVTEVPGITHSSPAHVQTPDTHRHPSTSKDICAVACTCAHPSVFFQRCEHTGMRVHVNASEIDPTLAPPP